MAKTANSADKRKDIFHYLKGAVAVLFGVFIVLAAYFGYLFGHMIFTNNALTSGTSAISYEISIKEGEGALAVGMELENAGIIESGLVFYVQSVLYECHMNPGNYILNSGMSSKFIVKYLEQEYKASKQEGSK